MQNSFKEMIDLHLVIFKIFQGLQPLLKTVYGLDTITNMENSFQLNDIKVTI